MVEKEVKGYNKSTKGTKKDHEKAEQWRKSMDNYKEIMDIANKIKERGVGYWVEPYADSYRAYVNTVMGIMKGIRSLMKKGNFPPKWRYDLVKVLQNVPVWFEDSLDKVEKLKGKEKEYQRIKEICEKFYDLALEFGENYEEVATLANEAAGKFMEIAKKAEERLQKTRKN